MLIFKNIKLGKNKLKVDAKLLLVKNKNKNNKHLKKVKNKKKYNLNKMMDQFIIILML
jgi:hypothetical protein